MLSFFKKRPSVQFDLGWMGVDIHSHLLPGIDDGSPDVSTSLGYLRKLEDLGIRKVICTPHVYIEIYPNNFQTIEASFRDLQSQRTPHQGAELSIAAEYMLDNEFKTLLARGDLLCLKGNYLLVEMSYIAETPDVETHIFQLLLAGYKPVLAHPERYLFYHQQFGKYERLREMGCLFQMNILSPSGYYGPLVKTAAEKLLKKGMIDFLGTDLHHERHLDALIAFVSSGGAQKLGEKYGFRNREM